MTTRFQHWTLAAAFIFIPSLASAQFGGFSPQTYSVQATTSGISEAIQTVRGAQPVVNDAVALAATRVAVAESHNRLALALADGGVSLWSLELGREIRRLNTNGVTALSFASDGATLVIGHDDGSVDLWDVDRGKRLSSVSGSSAVRAVALSADGTLLLIGGDAGSRVVSAKDGKEIARLTGTAALHPAQPLIAAANGADIALSAVGAANPLWKAEGSASLLAFSPDGAALVAVDKDGGIRIMDTASGHVTASAKSGFAPSSLSAGFGTAMVSGPNEIHVVDLASGAIGPAIKPHVKPMADAVLLRGGALVLSASSDGSLRLTDPKAASAPLGQMVVGHDGWAVVAASGEFDAENDGLDAVKWAAGENSFTLDQFSDSHFQPGILARLLTHGETEWRRTVAATAMKIAEEKRLTAEAALREKALQDANKAAAARRLTEEQARKAAEESAQIAEKASKAETARRLAEEQARKAAEDAARMAEEASKAEAAKKVIVSKEFAMPPQVAFQTKTETSSDSEDFELEYSLKDLGGGIEEVRLYQNGKLVYAQTGSNADTFKAKLAQGSNEFRLVALSRERIESRPAKVKVTYTGAERKSTLHVVAIGINKYKNPALNLNYGVGDARGIADYFGKQPKNLFKDVVIHTLYDEQATKANIINLLASLKDTKPEDSVVIYLAGHGDSLSDGWYFMPSEIRYPEREDEVRERGLPSSEINAKIKEMGAQKILMLVDACKSGAALVAFRGFEDRKALMQMSRSSGVHVVAAAGKEQFAAELAQLGHGLFTYTLLEGLSGKAEGKQPHLITVRGLTGYIEEQLPEISQSYKGVAQFPVVDSRGMDFPVATY